MSDQTFRRSNPERPTRDADTRVADETMEHGTKKERLGALLGMMSVAQVMPDVPLKEPGWHLCWLSTQNDQDSIHRREQAGYVPVKRDELVNAPPGTLKDGSTSDLVTCREMVLYKLPADLYQELMLHLHHKAPLDQEAGINELVEQMREMAAQNQTKVFIGSGVEALRRTPRRKPVFQA